MSYDTTLGLDVVAAQPTAGKAERQYTTLRRGQSVTILPMQFSEQIQSVMDTVDALRHQVDDHWQIPRIEAELLAQLVTIGRCISICEIGTSYGYSTLHLAAATAPLGGHVHSFDNSDKKHQAADKHLSQAGLREIVTLHLGDARTLVKDRAPAQPYDCLFIDAVKEQSFEYWDAVQPHLAPRAIIMTDNTSTHADQLASFVKHLRSQCGARSCAVPVGNGFELTVIGQ